MSFLKKIEKKIEDIIKNDDFPGEGEKPEGMREKVIRYPGGVVREKYYVKEEGEEKRTGGTAFGLMFLVWFIASIIFLIKFFGSEATASLGIAVFGQVFMVFGIAALCSRVKMGIVFAIVGAALGIGGLAHYFGNSQIKSVLIEKVVPLALCSVFLLVGIAMLIYAYKMYFIKRIRCTVPIVAQSTYIAKEIIHVSSGDDTVPRQMWVSYFRYYHNGNYYYCDCEAVPVSKPKPALGDYKEILINPDAPEEYWSKSSSKFESILIFILGLLFTIAGGFALYFLLAAF